MTSKLIIVAVAFLLPFQQVLACSAFLVDKKNHSFIVKSYDWHMSHGMLIANQRGVEKTAHQAWPWPWQSPIKWTSKFGSLTFNQYGREFPVSGMNEKGLVIEVLWLAEATFPWTKSGKTVNELQFVQYMLDNAETVEEMIELTKSVHISPVMFAPIHYFACDKSLDCALFQSIDRKFNIYHGDTLPMKLITNATYPKSVNGTKEFKAFGGDKAEIPMTDYDSVHRFARIAKQIKDIPDDAREQRIVDDIKTILDTVRGGTPDTEFQAVWNMIYDPKNLKVRYRKRYSIDVKKTAAFKSVDLKAIDFSCGKPVLAKVMEEQGEGEVTGSLTEYSQAVNKEMIKTAIHDYTSLPLIPDIVVNSANGYVNAHTGCVGE